MDFFLLYNAFFHAGFLACFLIGTFVFVAAATYGGILLAVPWLKRYGCYTIRNASSNHNGRVLHGAGIVVVAVTIGSLLSAKLFVLFLPRYRFADPDSTTLSLVLFAILFVLCLCSLTDDLKPKSVVYRLSLQVIATAFVITLIPGEVLLGYVPYALDKLFALLFIIAYANFVNFLDGCDGMCGTQVLSVTAGLVAVGFATSNVDFDMSVSFSALVLGSSMAGFLLLNWQPAKIFLGDAGSIPVGFLLAVLLLLASSYGHWEAAVILPLYGYCDAGITLLKRIVRREKFWQPHKKHFYKIALANGRSHKQIVRATVLVNVCLVVLTLFAAGDDKFLYDLSLIAVALALVAMLLWWMAKKPRTLRTKNA